MKRVLLFCTIVLGVALCGNSVVFAQDSPVPLESPEPRIRIPGLHFTAEEQLQQPQGESGKKYISIPFLGEYIAGVYRYAVAVASIVAVVMIIISGIQWTASGGNTDTISSAKKRITNAVTGLILALGSYTLLYTINPQLVQFQSLKLLYIETKDIEINEGEPDTGRFYPTIANRAACKPGDFDQIEGRNASGLGVGSCLAWVKTALSDPAVCGGITRDLQKNSAWDLAATFVANGKFRPCRLDGTIKDGDLVFMTSIGSTWIGLWQNFRQGGNGCTVADAAPAGKATRLKDGVTVNVPSVQGTPVGMPPVTHVGIYIDGKIYHLTTGVEADDRDAIKPRAAVGTKKFSNWKDIKLNGDFTANGVEFIAGYASW